MDSALFLEKLILIVVILAVTLVMALYFTFGERKIAAFFQDRLGPNRVGPFGLLQPFADGLKLMMKEAIWGLMVSHPICTGIVSKM